MHVFRVRRGVLPLALIVALAAGCSNNLDDVRRITSEELRAEYTAGRAVIVDVRSAAAFDQLHIRGAYSIPYGEISARADELPREKLVATYCT